MMMFNRNNCGLHAILLSLSLASASPALAMTEAERCAWKADKVDARYAKCLARSATRLSNVLDGSTQEEDENCAEQFSRSMDVLERRATFKDVGEECLARISEAGQNAAQAGALVAAGRDLDDYSDLSVDDLAGSAIGDYLDASYDEGYDDGEASVDITSDNAGVAAASYASGYSDGEGSVDITSDNAGVASASYTSGYAAGEASVDITIDNQAQYDQGYTDGQGSVDITSDNEASYDQGYFAGQSSVDITTDNVAAALSDNAALCAGAGGTYVAPVNVCNVDITTDNAAAALSDNAVLCSEARGTYDATANTCTPPPGSYNCFVGGFCARAAVYTQGVWSDYPNVYEGATPDEGAALAAGCNGDPFIPWTGAARWRRGAGFALSYIQLGTTAGSTGANLVVLILHMCR